MGKLTRKGQILRNARQILAREGDAAKRKSAYLHLKERLEEYQRPNRSGSGFKGPLFVVCVAQALQHFPTFYTHAVTRRRKVRAWRTPVEQWWEKRKSEWAQCSCVGCKRAQDGHAGPCTFLAIGDVIQVLYFISGDCLPKVARGTVVSLRGSYKVTVLYEDAEDAEGQKEELDLRDAQWKFVQ